MSLMLYIYIYIWILALALNTCGYKNRSDVLTSEPHDLLMSHGHVID